MAYAKALGLSALGLGLVLSGCEQGAPSSVDVATGAAGASVDDEGGTPVVQEPEPVHQAGSAGSASSHGHSRPPAAESAGGAPNDDAASGDEAGNGGERSEPVTSPDSDDAGAAGARDEASGGTGSGGTAATSGGSGGMSIGGTSSGGAAANGGSPATGGAGASNGGGTASNGGTSSGGAGAASGGGASAAGSGGGDDCTFSVSYGLSGAMPTVAVVDWSTTFPGASAAKIVYTLSNPASDALNTGGVAPVDAGGAHHDWLVGLKPSRDYTFYLEVGAGGATCRSETYSFTTGPLPNTPALSRAVANRAAVSNGFIVTSGGFGSDAPAFIFDADGDVVWAAPAPKDCSRVRLDYAAKNVWMLSANATNAGGDVRSISLDGATIAQNLAGFERAHHDLTALPDGGVAALAWSASGLDPESDLVERRPDGSTSVLFHVGSNLYAGGPSAFGGTKISYHANSVAYHPSDASFTIGDRNPSSFVKVSSAGAPLWQFGGSCSNAKAARCAAGSWQINHGHQLLDDGTFLFFNNTGMGKTTPSSAYAFELDAGSALNVSQVEQWAGKSSEHSDTLGDVQRLPNGNTLVTFSNNGVIYELDSSWNVVQTWRADAFGYSEWRPTLYGPPVR